MMGESGLRHGSNAAALRPSPQTVSALPGDDPRSESHPRVGPPPLHCRGRGGDPSAIAALSPFVPTSNDSESSDADPTGTSLALSDRLARDQPHRPLRTRGWPLRTLQATSWKARRAACRQRRRVVGCRYPPVARWTRSAAATPARLCGARRDPDDAQARLSRHRPPQSRPERQWPALAQPRRVLSALPHDPRRGRASSAPMVERLPPARARRPLHRSIPLGPLPAAAARSGRRRACPRISRQLAVRIASEARPPMAFRFPVTGRPFHDRTLSKLQDVSDGEITSRR